MTAIPFEINSLDQLRIQFVIALWGFVMKYSLKREENTPKSFAPVTDIYEGSKTPDFF